MLARLRYRRQRRAYRDQLRRWNADGGDERFRYDYALSPESVVLDLGGYEGQWAWDLYARQRCRIHVFEPVTRFADAIGERFQNNSDVEVHAFALGARTRDETISVAGASSSIHKRKAERARIAFRDVADWFEEASIHDVALMKINIEGGEYELLERMLETDLVRRVSSIQVQFHYFIADAEARMERIQEGLAATHVPTWQYRFIWENWERREASG
jgi:FkbM family methyltransferase